MANKFQAAAMFFLLLSAFSGRMISLTLPVWTLPSVFGTVIGGFSMIVSFVLGVFYLIIASQRTSEHHTFFSALFHFMVTYCATWLGRKYLKRFRKDLLSPREAQESRLKEIITRNKDTVYGVMLDLQHVRNLEDFKEKHPITKYDHYEPFVQRITKGETNVMTTESLNRLVLTSGTTGKGKLIPKNVIEMVMPLMMITVIQAECFPNVQPMQKIFRLHCNTKLRKSEGGIPIAAGTVMERQTARLMPMFSSPPDAFLIEGINEAFYIHFLFALRERNLGSAMGIFSSTFVDGFNYFRENWPLMVTDIANGTINKNLNIDPEIRESLERAIGSGDVQRAEEVRRECEKGQQGIMKRLWPFMEYVAVIDNVGIRKTLMKTFGEGLTFFSPLYGASEAVVGINFDPKKKGEEEYVFMVTNYIYEFILEGDIDEPYPDTYFIDEVEVGKNYEVVVSQIYGLYRYRLGDVVQITGFYEKTPKVKFLYRTATLLNLFGEKVGQPLVTEALNSALSQQSLVKVKHYCVAESPLLSGLKEYSDAYRKGSHYIFFLELDPAEKGTPSPQINTEEMAKKIDDTIYNVQESYRNYKDKNQIHPSNVYLVKTGAFQELKRFILANSSASELQFKMPLKLRTTEMAQILLRNRIDC